MRGLRTFLTFSLLFWTSACSLAPGVLLTPTPTQFVYPTAVVTPIPPLTAGQVRNAEYTILGFDNSSHIYRFVDGKYNRGTDPTAPDFVDIKLLDTIPFGDLDEDNLNDAAVLIAENYGGSGVFVSVAAVLNENGQPQHVASTLVDDRPQINKLEIRDGEIFLGAVVHGPQDPACCPTMAVTRTYKLIGTSLVLVNATSQTPNGAMRSIVIETPPSGVDASGALVIRGNVTIAPFENTLSFRAYNEQGNELSSGPVTVTAPDLGAPGTFTVTLDLASITPGRIRIEIADLSAADGSVLALDSVEVIVR